jgi:hypothetical protein
MRLFYVCFSAIVAGVFLEMGQVWGIFILVIRGKYLTD